MDRSLPPLSCTTSPAPARPVTAPPIEKPSEVHATSRLVASAPWIVPVELRTTQFCPLGCVRTTTAYVAPSISLLANTNGPSPAIGRSLPPLFCNTRPEPVRPETLPRIENCPVAHATAMSVTFALATLPLPRATVQVCAGDVG